MKSYFSEHSIKVSKDGINNHRSLLGYKIADFGSDIEQRIKDEYPEDILELYKKLHESCRSVFFGLDNQNECKKIYFESNSFLHKAVVAKGNERRYKIYLQGPDAEGIHSYESWETDSSFEVKIKQLATSRAVFSKIREMEEFLLRVCNNYNPSCLNDLKDFLEKESESQLTWFATNPEDLEFTIYYA